MNRTAPQTGYDFGNKRQYRRDVWATFRAAFPAIGMSRADAHMLLMPSIEGDEIEVALNAGFREDHLHIVDRNPAIVATLKRRYRRLNTHGGDLPYAAKRIRCAGIQLSGANLDLTSCCGPVAGQQIQSFIDSGVMKFTSLLAVTVLRGRESGFDELKKIAVPVSNYVYKKTLTDGDKTRLVWIAAQVECRKFTDNCFYLTHLVRHNSYKSGTQTMLWSIFGLRVVSWNGSRYIPVELAS